MPPPTWADSSLVPLEQLQQIAKSSGIDGSIKIVGTRYYSSNLYPYSMEFI